MEKKNPIEEAERYLQNAKDILREKAVKNGDSYQDAKYVKMAGDTAWKGCLIAVEAVFLVKSSKGKARTDVNDYKEAIAKRDKKLLTYFNEGYSALHLSMGYDGSKDYYRCKRSIELAELIISSCKSKYKA